MAGLPHDRGYKRWESHGSFCWRAYYVEQLEVVPQVVGILEYMLAVVDHALADERRRYSSCRDDPLLGADRSLCPATRDSSSRAARFGYTEGRNLPSVIRVGVPSHLNLNSQAFDPLIAIRNTRPGRVGSEMSQSDAPGLRAHI
jgi:hypothetical protein